MKGMGMCVESWPREGEQGLSGGREDRLTYLSDYDTDDKFNL